MIEQIFGNPSNFMLFLAILVGVLIFLFIVRLFLRFVFYILLGVLAIALVIGGVLYFNENPTGEGNLTTQEVNLTRLNQLAEKGKGLLEQVNWGAVLSAVARSAMKLEQNTTTETGKGEGEK